jgi:hypothetical protein
LASNLAMKLNEHLAMKLDERLAMKLNEHLAMKPNEQLANLVSNWLSKLAIRTVKRTHRESSSSKARQRITYIYLIFSHAPNPRLFHKQLCMKLSKLLDYASQGSVTNADFYTHKQPDLNR